MLALATVQRLAGHALATITQRYDRPGESSAGFAAHIAKPVSSAELTGIVAMLVAQVA